MVDLLREAAAALRFVAEDFLLRSHSMEERNVVGTWEDHVLRDRRWIFVGPKNQTFTDGYSLPTLDIAAANRISHGKVGTQVESN